MPSHSYVSIAQAASAAGVSTKTIRRWIAAGQLPAYRAGTKIIRLKLADVEAVLKPMPTTGSAA